MGGGDGAVQGTDCQRCTENSYKQELGSQMCTPCPAHSSAPQGSTSVVACVCWPEYISAGDGSCDRVCAAGFEAGGGEDGETSCIPCPANFYKPAAGNSRCLPCPAHSFTLLHNSTHVTHCMCEMGYVWNNTSLQCDICPAGQFNNEANSTECFQCETDC